MNQIIKSIYSENNNITNLSLFLASFAAFYIYAKFSDIVLVTLSFISTFSLSKVIFGYLVSYIGTKSETSKIDLNFSDIEKDIIKLFIDSGGSFLKYSDHEKGTLSGYGLVSLENRGYIEFIDNSIEGNVPSGFKLREDIYTHFLKKK